MKSWSAEDHELLEGIGLNFSEAAFLCEALAALWQSPEFTERMWSDLRQIGRAKGLDEKWAAAGDGLFDRLKKINKDEELALMRAALQFCRRRDEPTARLLRDLGLLPSRRSSTSAPGPNPNGNQPDA